MRPRLAAKTAPARQPKTSRLAHGRAGSQILKPLIDFQRDHFCPMSSNMVLMSFVPPLKNELFEQLPSPESVRTEMQ